MARKKAAVTRKGQEHTRRLRELMIEKLGLKGKGPHVFIEGLDSYAEEYKRLIAQAKREHGSLLDVIECDDTVFYGLSGDEQLRRLGLDQFKRVMLTTTDAIEFSQDENTSVNGVVNEKRDRPAGVAVTGCTSILEYKGRRRSVIFMRRKTGAANAERSKGIDPRDITAGLKLAAFVHELGHVDDFEKGIHYKGDTIALVDAETYAHHHACKTMVENGYIIVLGYYLQGLREMAASNSAYVRIAAERALGSSEYQSYVTAISDRQNRFEL